MNRGIRFRLWDGKKMIDQEECLSGSNSFVQFVNFWTGYEDPAEWAEYILMQYTGLKDRNGVEIYEGDILQFDNGYEHMRYTGEVIFNNGCFVSKQKIGAHHIANIDDGGGGYFEFKVIGNIYENPDLL